MAGVQNVKVDFAGKLAIVQFDPEKVAVSKLVEKLDGTRFTASLDRPVARVHDGPNLKVRVVTDAAAYAAGAEAKVKVEIQPTKGGKLQDVSVRSQTSWTKKGGTAILAKPVERKIEVPLAFVAPKEPGTSALEVTVTVSFRLPEDGEDAERNVIKLHVPVPMKKDKPV